MRTAYLLPAILAVLAGTAQAAGSPSAEPAPAFTRHASPTLQPFGSDAAFMAYLAEARAAAHARGNWWYASLSAWQSGAGPDQVRRLGLEVLPGSHGEYRFEEASLPGGGRLYYSKVDLTMIRPGVDVVWPGLRRRGRVLAGDTIGGDEERLYRQARRHPLWSPGEIYRPVRDTLEPNIHSLTICPARAVDAARPSACRTTAFIGPRGGILLVTDSHAYVWTVPEYGDLEAIRGDPGCALHATALEAEGLPSLVYRLPLAGGPLELVGTRGESAWGSGFRVEAGRLRALVAWPRIGCGNAPRGDLTAPPARLSLLDAPLSLFARRLAEAPRSFEARLPATASAAISAHFSDDWLLYGELSYEFNVPYGDQRRRGRLFAVPIAHPASVRTIDLPHDLVSIVQAGDRALLTGYEDSTGLKLSVLDLGAEPRIVSTMRLPGLRQRAGLGGFIGTDRRSNGSVVVALPTAELDEPLEEAPESLRPGKILRLLIDASGRIRAYDSPPRPDRGR
jgi:hypothetical protein